MAVPEAMPVTIPVEPTVAADVFDELQTPPPVASLKAIVAPGHMEPAHVIVPAVADEFTVITVVAVAVPQLLVTV